MNALKAAISPLDITDLLSAEALLIAHQDKPSLPLVQAVCPLFLHDIAVWSSVWVPEVCGK